MEHNRELLRLLPGVLRARDFHLYTDGGRRLTDLWLEGGKAILGHKPPKVLVELKNSAERGLFCSLPHPLERRFLKALGIFFPGSAFRLYADEGSRDRVLKDTGLPEKEISVWRPLLEPDSTYSVCKPVLPWPLGPSVLVLAKNMDASFPPGDLVPPVLLAPAERALHNLSAELKARSPNRFCPRYPKIEKIVAAQNQKNGLWRRRGIYLFAEPEMDMEKYKELFLRFLENDFLLPPSPLEPLILPGVMSDGEELKLAGLLTTG